MSDVLIGFSTCGSRDEAERIAGYLVEERLAACVNILPGIQSVYRWQGKLERAEEWLLLLKTTSEKSEALQTGLRHIHSYEVPELVLLPVSSGLPEYLAWVAAETSPNEPKVR